MRQKSTPCFMKCQISIDFITCRDHGIPQYNDAREGLNLTKRSSFSQITGDRYLQRKLEEIYGNVDKVRSRLLAHDINQRILFQSGMFSARAEDLTSSKMLKV